MAIEYRDFIVVDEEYIKENAKEMRFHEADGYQKLMFNTKEYLNAGLTPLFLADKNTGELFLTTQEKFCKKYH